MKEGEREKEREISLWFHLTRDGIATLAYADDALTS